MKNIKITENLKNLFIVCFLLLIFAVLFGFVTGCTGIDNFYPRDGKNLEAAGDGAAAVQNYTAAAAREAADEFEDYNYYADYDYGYDYEYGNYYAAAEDAPAADRPAAPQTGGGDYFTYLANIPAEMKIIRDANIVMEVESAEKAYDDILLNVVIFGGYEAGRDMRIGGNNYMVVNATLEIPSTKLDMFLNEIKNVGTVLSSTVSSSDITDQYYDSRTRLETLEKILARYYTFLDSAKDVDEQLKITSYINDVTYEIEQIKGRLKKWDALVDYSTVTLYLYRPADEPTTEPATDEPTTEPETTTERTVEWSLIPGEDMGYNIMQGIADTCSAIIRVIQGLITWLIVASPVLAPVALVIFIVVRYVKKKIREKKKDNGDNSDNNTDNV